MRLIYGLLLLAVCHRAVSQESMIVLRDSVKVRTELISIVENNVFTKAGTFGLTEIYSVRFQAASDVSMKSQLVDQLLAAGVIVYAANKKLEQKPLTSTPIQNPVETAKTSTPSLSNREEKFDDDEDLPTGSFGIGVGQDYGGIGGRVTFLPDQHFGFFGSVGYILVGVGYNFGAMARLQPQEKVVPTFSLMYGYNAAIKISGAPQYDKIYNGVSIGAGLMFKSYRQPTNFWHFEVILPFRPSEFDQDFNALKSNSSITGLEKPWPITISIGYHFSF